MPGILILLLLAAMACGEMSGSVHTASCVPEAPCLDTDALHARAVSAAKGITVSHDKNILLKRSSFDKITKKERLHGCVLLKICDFYQAVFSLKLNLSEQDHISDRQGVFVDLVGLMQRLRRCVRVKEHKCRHLYAQAEQKSLTETTNEKRRGAKDWAIIQITKLQRATEELMESETQDRAVDELQALHSYIPGKGVRRRMPIKAPNK
ncbi:uncharacterized protein LOC114765002 [Denticeps clupeoides]|uniref:uncharacterized protein LOC114765002 n=1 Tax=Denticeps clupeoides TaxID=299321 RepID=UPI0010A3CE0A|nr:uncharacterized protein LOC114765002 [Denticeps clupeoides]